MRIRFRRDGVVLWILAVIVVLAFTTCEKPERILKFDTLEADANDVTHSSALLKGEVTDLGSRPIEQHGFLLSESSVPNLGQQNTVEKPLGVLNIKKVFHAQFTELTANTTYYFRAYMVVDGLPELGSIKNFTTHSLPVVTTTAISDITTTGASSGGEVTDDGGVAVTARGVCWSTTTDPTVALTTKTSDGTGEGVFTSTITGLISGTTYYVRAYATNQYGTSYGNPVTFTTLPTITDYDGNIYNTVQIGTQLWIQENLKTTHYNNGNIIANITDNTAWSETGSGAYCWYDNDEGTYKDPYGALYTWWTTVDVRNICPAGWHVPTDTEWSTLTDYLGGESVAGGKLKETGTTHWTSPNTGATNETGFTALPGSSRNNDGTFNNIGNNGLYWSSTESSSGSAWSRNMSFDNSYAYRDNNNRQEYGYSVRCVRGELPLAKTEDATAVTVSSATLNAQVNPNSASTTVTFEYGLTTSYGSEVTASESPVAGSVPAPVSAGISGLSESTTYHYRVKAVNSFSTTYSADITFTTTTLSSPAATTESATAVASSSATLNGTVNANDLSTTVTFEYGLTTGYGSEITAAESPVTGNTATSVTAALSSLTASTTYHYRVKAVSTGGTAYGEDKAFTTNSSSLTVTDFDGNVYNTVQIGSQIWMAENLKTTHYADGSQLVDGTGAGAITNDYTTKYWFVYDDIESNAVTYGRLYTWAAVMNGSSSSVSNPSGVQGVCPAGWHVPSLPEWTQLIDYLGGENIAGGPLKEAGNSHWLYSNVGATNTSGFTGLPHGYRNYDGNFYGMGTYGAYITSTSENSYSHGAIMLRTENAEAYSGNYDKDDAKAVRCVKD